MTAQVTDVLLDANHKVDITSGDLALVTGVDQTVQRVGIRMRFFKGEFHLDTRQGIPYLQEVLQKGTPHTRLYFIFAHAISTTPGIKSLDSLTVKLDAAIRTLEVDWTATDDSGNPVQASEAFVIP